jgi:hypothetical protein
MVKNHEDLAAQNNWKDGAGKNGPLQGGGDLAIRGEFSEPLHALRVPFVVGSWADNRVRR